MFQIDDIGSETIYVVEHRVERCQAGAYCRERRHKGAVTLRGDLQQQSIAVLRWPADMLVTVEASMAQRV